jgi:hypothetical protein
MAEPKDEEVKTRVTKTMKSELNAIADDRGESESVIVREAFALYLKERAMFLKDRAPAPSKQHPAGSGSPVNYRKSRKGPKPRLSV